MDWSTAQANSDLLEFTRVVSALRRDHPVFRRRRFFRGTPAGDGHLADIAWLTPSGREMADQDWATPYARAMTVFLNGEALTEPDPHGERVRDDSFLIMLSADREPLEFTVPGPKYGEGWVLLLDTAAEGSGTPDGAADLRPGDRLLRTGGSVAVLRRTTAS